MDDDVDEESCTAFTGCSGWYSGAGVVAGEELEEEVALELEECLPAAGL